MEIILLHWVNGIFILLACICNAGMDALKTNYATSFASKWNPYFWNPALSWKAKYNSRLPDALTDGWHLLKMFTLGFLFIAGSLNVTGSLLTDSYLFIMYSGVWNTPFNFFYSKLRGKK